MKHLSLFILTLAFLSCNNEVDFEKSYYERISRIKFPEKYTVMETYDNGETFTTTSFKVDSITLKDFSKRNSFDTIKYPFYLFYAGKTCLKGPKPGLENKDDLLYISGQSKTNTWLYIIDLKKEMLWAQIMYPDWSGDSPSREHVGK
jgi:hypothetical protein